MTPSPATSAGLPWEWGDLSGTVAAPAPPGHDGPVASRGVRVAAPLDRVWRWVQQLQVAPYSYDLVDNLGRRSPRTLTRGVPEFRPGARLLVVFTVRSVEPQQRVVLEMAAPRAAKVIGALTMTYAVSALPHGSTALRCDLHLSRPAHRFAALNQAALLWGDLPMMRKQLLTLKALAEQGG